jgi:adenylate cyclase
LRENLARYFSPNVVRRLAHAGTEARSFRSQKAAILFADLRGFTALAEAMPAHEVAAFLNEFRARVAEAINRLRGTIDKFIGDGVMAIFGLPEPGAQDAGNAIQARLELVSSIEQWSVERVRAGMPAVEMGVGIHYGEVLAGALGDENRLEYTVIGDTVNTTARIEEETAALRTPILVSAEALEAAPDLRRNLAWRFPPRPIAPRPAPAYPPPAAREGGGSPCGAGPIIVSQRRDKRLMYEDI